MGKKPRTKTEQFLKDKGIHLGYVKGIKILAKKGPGEFSMEDLMEEYARNEVNNSLSDLRWKLSSIHIEDLEKKLHLSVSAALAKVERLILDMIK